MQYQTSFFHVSIDFLATLVALDFTLVNETLGRSFKLA